MKQHRYISEQGYVYVMKRDHPRATKDGHVFEHILVAEKALGKLLPDGAEIHHSNEVRDDNRSSNLVVCPNHSYHILLPFAAIPRRVSSGVSCSIIPIPF